MSWFNFAHHEVTLYILSITIDYFVEGMRRNFLEMRTFLENQYPQLIGYIDGENYPPPLHAQYIAQFTSMMYFGGIMLIMGGDFIFQNLGFAQPPAFYDLIKSNKMMAFGNNKIHINFELIDYGY